MHELSFNTPLHFICSFPASFTLLGVVSSYLFLLQELPHSWAPPSPLPHLERNVSPFFLSTSPRVALFHCFLAVTTFFLSLSLAPNCLTQADKSQKTYFHIFISLYKLVFCQLCNFFYGLWKQSLNS